MKAYWQVALIEVFLLFSLDGIYSQETAASSGGRGISNRGTIDFTVGQVVYDAITTIAGTSSQGVQQPFEIFLVTSVNEIEGTGYDMVIYPNPVSAFLILEIKAGILENLTYQLYDINGKLFQEKGIFDKETTIRFEEPGPSEYFLKIFNKKAEIKTFKILKNR